MKQKVKRRMSLSLSAKAQYQEWEVWLLLSCS